MYGVDRYRICLDFNGHHLAQRVALDSGERSMLVERQVLSSFIFLVTLQELFYSSRILCSCTQRSSCSDSISLNGYNVNLPEYEFDPGPVSRTTPNSIALFHTPGSTKTESLAIVLKYVFAITPR